MNCVILMGRLTRDPEIRYSQGANGQMAIARFTLAVDRRNARQGASEATADFISCVCFSHTAEFVEKYVTKGKKIVLRGRIQTGSYTNKEGKTIYTTDVIAEDIEFAESKSAGSGNTAGFANANQTNATDSFMVVTDEDFLPFS